MDCKLCLKECAFLQQYGSPKEIAGRFAGKDDLNCSFAFECSLCGLCEAVCPVQINPGRMFFEMRREAASHDQVNYGPYKPLLSYEIIGSSSLFSYYSMPEGCDTVLFPGCAFSGTRPDLVKRLYKTLVKKNPGLGLVLDCCGKSSHDLGRQQHFQNLFDELASYLQINGVKKILVLCPNCHKIFSGYGDMFETEMVYEQLPPATKTVIANRKVTIHDPCGIRDETTIHKKVRGLVSSMAETYDEMEHRSVKTLCCGEGGGVGFVRPDFSGRWSERRHEEASEAGIITYCSGCMNYLSRQGSDVYHLLDLYFASDSDSVETKAVKAPWTYLNRLKLKSYFKKELRNKRVNQRPLAARSEGVVSSTIRLIRDLIG